MSKSLLWIFRQNRLNLFSGLLAKLSKSLFRELEWPNGEGVMREWFGLVLMAVMVGGVQAGEPIDQETARFRSFNGLTIAQFIDRTGLAPRDAYDVAGGRVFVVDGRPASIVLAPSHGVPGVITDATCRMLITTKQNGRGSGADGFTITTIARRGGCANI